MSTLTIIAVAAVIAAFALTAAAAVGQSVAYKKGAVTTAVAIGYGATALIPTAVATAFVAAVLPLLSA